MAFLQHKPNHLILFEVGYICFFRRSFQIFIKTRHCARIFIICFIFYAVFKNISLIRGRASLWWEENEHSAVHIKASMIWS